MDNRRMALAVMTAMSTFGMLSSEPVLALESGLYAGLTVGQADQGLEREREFSESRIHAEAAEVGATFRSSLDTKSAAFGAFAGWQFGRWFAVETALAHLGRSEYDYTLAFPEFESDVRANVEFEARAVSLAAILTIPAGESFAIGLRAGAAYSTLKVDSLLEDRFDGVVEEARRDSDSEKNLAPVYGASFEYLPTRSISLRLDWQRFRDVGEDYADVFEGIDIDTLAISALMRF